jgi:hypothetical protein
MRPRGTKRPRRVNCDGNNDSHSGCSGGSNPAEDFGPVREDASPPLTVTLTRNGHRIAEGGAASSLRIADNSGGAVPRTRHTLGNDNAIASGEPTFREMIDTLDEETVRNTLARLATMAPSAQTVIKQVYTQQLRERMKEQQRPPDYVDFDHYSKKAWHALYRSREAKEWAILDEIHRTGATRHTLATVSGHIAEIRSEIREATSFKTKLNALVTVRKILKSILLGSDELAGNVRSEFCGGSDGVGHDVLIVLMCMTEEEMIRAGGTADEKGTLAQKFRWCRDEARKLGLTSLKSLDTVVEMMEGTAIH